MKKISIILFAMLCSATLFGCSDNDDNNEYEEPVPQSSVQMANRNLTRAIALVDTAMSKYFSGQAMTMARYYNPYTKQASPEKGSVWMYTSAIEAVNSVMESLKDTKAIMPQLYDENFGRYTELLRQLYDGLEYYSGTFTLTSYTQTKEWTVYAVNRADEKGKADVSGINNVYDDQEWLVREMLRSYKITGDETYLKKAEALTEYVLDGWDCTPDANGGENGGIPWGPGYTSKHACSNGPMVSPLVWLYEIYRGKEDKITYRRIDLDGKRYEVSQKKSAYYLDFAKKVYDWQKKYLMMDNGVYYDLAGASSGEPEYESVDGVTYRKGLAITSPSGRAYTYNSGVMLSGGADLYRVTRIGTYRNDLAALAQAAFAAFAEKDATKQGYYTYPVDGFSPWFNDVLMRGYLAVYDVFDQPVEPLESFQANLDYGYANYLYKGMLPINLLVGWSWTKANNNVEALFTFASISEYAMLAHYERQKLDE